MAEREQPSDLVDIASAETSEPAPTAAQPAPAAATSRLEVRPASGAAAQAGPRRKRRPGMWGARVLLALVFLAGLFCSILPVGRAAVRAAVLLPAFLSAAEPLPLQLAGEPIHHASLTISSSNGPVYIDIYAPAGAPSPIPGSREAVVNIPGVGDNRADPQLINFSESMARAGVVVVNLTTPVLIDFDLSPADTDAVVRAFQLAVRQPGVDPRRVGIIGFSGGTVLACLAAADSRIRDQVAFIALFGTLFKVADLLRDFGQRYVIADGQKIPYQPYDVAVTVMANVMADALPYDDAQTLLGAFAPGGQPISDPETAFQTPGAADAYHLLAGDDPAHVEQHLHHLPPEMQTLLRQLSPSEYLQQVRAPIYLLHDHNDPSIPFTESRDFDAALTRLGHPHDFAEFGIFHHTEITTGFGVGPALVDGSKLFRILVEVLLAES